MESDGIECIWEWQHVADVDESHQIIEDARCLKFNWWHFSYFINRIALRSSGCLSIHAWGLVAVSDQQPAVRRRHATAISFNCVKKISNEFKQLVVILPCSHLFFRNSWWVARCLNANEKKRSVLLSCLLYSLYFMLRLSIWNVGGTYRILNKLWIANDTREEKQREIENSYHESFVRCTNV